MELLDELREDFLICNICFEEYKDPKQLPCLHTFCRQCLGKYIVGRVVETGLEWFPCPFCRKAIHPTQGGGVRAWADSFPTNFLLSQLSSKLQDKTAQLCAGPYDVTTERDVSNREKCLDHPQCYLVGYCTRRRCGVCEECCVQRHVDCIRCHVRERDSRQMAEERRAECKEFLGALQIKLEGVKDTMTSREAELRGRSETLQRQTAAALEDLRAKLDLILAEQKRHLAAQLDSAVSGEASRLQAVKQQVLEVSEANTRVCKRLESVQDVDLGIKDLAVLDKAQMELQAQDLTVDRLRKECVLQEMCFQAGGEAVDQLLKGLTLGQLLTGTEARAAACGGARPRVPRYAAQHAPTPSAAVYYSQDPWGSQPDRERALSPLGGAAASSSSSTPLSALFSSPSTAAGPSTNDDVVSERFRQRPEALPAKDEPHKKPQRAPTVPDFGAVLIEESKRSRSRSLPRRAGPTSEGSAVVGRQGRKLGVAKAVQDRRAPPMETEITGDSDEGSVKKPESGLAVLERAPRVFYAPGNPWPAVEGSSTTNSDSSARSFSDNGARTAVKGRRYQNRFERSVSSPPTVAASDHPSTPASSEDETLVDVSPADSELRKDGGFQRLGGIKETVFDSIPAEDRDLTCSDVDVGAVGGARVVSSNSIIITPGSRSEEEDRLGDEGGQKRLRRIVCVRHFPTTLEGEVKNEPGLVGMVPVARNRLAASDRWNKMVKLIDIGGRVLDVLALAGEAEPWDLALRRPGQLAVTYPKEQKIRMVEIVDGAKRLNYRSHFMTREGYASLARYNDTSLIAGVCPPFGTPKVHVIDYMGAVLRVVDSSSVAYPRCLDVCEGEEVVVSDWNHHNIKVFPKDGICPSPRLTYSGVPGARDALLKAPMGVAWDGGSHVFVVDGKACRLHALNTRTGACTAIFCLPQPPGVELKLVSFLEASPELCSSERALVVTTTSGIMQIYDLCPY